MGDLAMALRPSASKVNLVDWVSWLSVPGLVTTSLLLFIVSRYGPIVWRFIVG